MTIENIYVIIIFKLLVAHQFSLQAEHSFVFI